VDIKSEDEVRVLVSHRYWNSQTKRKKALVASLVVIATLALLFAVLSVMDRSAEYESESGDIVKTRNWDVELNGYDMTRTDSGNIGWLVGLLVCFVITAVIALSYVLKDQKEIRRQSGEAIKEWHIETELSRGQNAHVN